MLEDRIRHTEERIRAACAAAGRKREDVTLVAVTKTRKPEEINRVLRANIADIGENRVQEYLGKRDALDAHRFHMIGHLQKNKVRQVVGITHLIHSVDSAGLAEEISRRSEQAGCTTDVLLEVNTSGEESKFGLRPDAVRSAAEQIFRMPAIRVRGLMTLAAFLDDPELVRPSFSLLRSLRDELLDEFPEQDVRELSMGMTNDFEVAIEEGATLVRIGTALFGPRE